VETKDRRSQSRLKLDVIETHAPWQAALLPVGPFPLPGALLESVRPFLLRLADVLVKQQRLSQEVLFQVWKLSPQNGADVMSENLSRWPMELGLGVWPDRKPPSGWTEERMVDAAAAAFRGDEPELPSHRLLRLTADERERGNAADAMRGFGVAIECFSKQTWESISKSGSSLFVPTIKERQFQQADFHFPVLDRNSILAAGSAEQLDAWMCGIEVYVRASAEDKGILILSKLPLEGLLQSTQELLESA
jgi:hypothetical protein